MNAAEVAERVYRLGTQWASFYLVLDGEDVLMVDAGYPRYRRQLDAALASLGRRLGAVAAVIVTHHHVDHTGTAEHARSRGGARVLVHERDAPMVTGERRSHVPPGFYRQSWRPSMVRYLVHTVLAGGARYRPVSAVDPLVERPLDLPARPRVIPSPGHTAGHCSVLLEERGVLFTGDALVNFDYASGERGVKLHRFNEDRPGARKSLDVLADLDAGTLLFGHGDPWNRGAREAVERARAAA
jgi:glyoxylase-like metal-dependent hydrolase (beta-lactamase superfamily II)